jgi:steroid 5-alpha reductase family enzyme
VSAYIGIFIFFFLFFFTSSHSLPLTNPPTPSDFGEHLVWCGLALVCAGADPTNPWHLAKCLVSPLWSVVFLTFTSLMLLEKRMDRAFAGKKADKKLRRKYADYKAAVPVLVPEVFPYAYVFNYGAPTP